MIDWFKFEAIILDKREKTEHSPPLFPVYVWGVTETTARDKLVAEYPTRHYEITSFRLIAGDGGND